MGGIDITQYCFCYFGHAVLLSFFSVQLHKFTLLQSLNCLFSFLSFYCTQSNISAMLVWGPVVQWLVQRFRSERLRVRSRRSATFTPSAHVRRQSLPVWPPTLNNYLYLFTFFAIWDMSMVYFYFFSLLWPPHTQYCLFFVCFLLFEGFPNKYLNLIEVVSRKKSMPGIQGKRCVVNK